MTTAERTRQTRQIKQWMRELFELSPEVAIVVSELACKEPGCPPLETVIAVLHGPGETEQHKIHRPIADIDADSLRILRDGQAPHDHQE
jgi:hypothetical protein